MKNQNAAPTTPPCFSRWLRSSSLLFESSRRTVNRSLLLDIPTRWEPRAKQSRTVALLAALRAAALFESSRRTKKEKPEHGCVLVFLGAPNNENPNLFSIGEGFGFFVFFGKQNEGSIQLS
ncbi:MAG: hypothetical protein KH145_14065, partial [Faecalibacterium prausnitzii]|nr:hypothetical protein [Faecalibacterium prausnitzii]